MTNLEISKALALAIGWKEPYGDPDVQIVWKPGGAMHIEVWFQKEWRVFDYRDWNVIGPIAEKFDCFPWVLTEQLWEAPVRAGSNVVRFCQANTPQKAVALAVIGARK